MNAPMKPDIAAATALGHDPRPKSAVSTMTGVVGLAGLIAWTAVARAFGMDGPARGAGRPRSPARCRCWLWSILVDKVHRNPTTGHRLGQAAAAAPGDARHQHRQDRRPVGHLGGDRRALLHRPLVLGRAPISSPCRCSAVGDRADARPFDSLCPLARPAPGRAARRRLAFRPDADRPARAGRPRRELHDFFRAWAVKGFFLAFMISIVPGNWADTIRAESELDRRRARSISPAG